MSEASINNLINECNNIADKLTTQYLNRMRELSENQLKTITIIKGNLEKTIAERAALNVSQNSISYDDSLKEYHQNNFAELDSLFKNLLSIAEVKTSVNETINEVGPFFEKLPEKISVRYNTNFTQTKTGVGSSIVLKGVGNFFYFLRSFPRISRNILARLFWQKAKPLNPRTHKIHYRKIVKGFLLTELANHLREITKKYQEELAEHAIAIFNSEADFIKSNYSAGIRAFEVETTIKQKLSDIEAETHSFFEGYKETFRTLLEKSGTWEFPKFWIIQKARRKEKKARKRWENTLRIWNATFYALYEDWRFREVLYGYIMSINKIADGTQKMYLGKIDKILSPAINQKKEYLTQLIARIPNDENVDNQSLKRFFTTELYKFQKETRNQTIIPDLEKTSGEVTKLLQKIEVDITERLMDLPEKSGVVKEPDYKKGIKKSEIYFFSPREFIEFDCLPIFFKKLERLVEVFTTNFNEIIHEFSDFDQITDFTIDTAISLAGSERNTPEQTILMFKEGLKRSLNILDRITDINQKSLGANLNELTEIFGSLNNRITRLDDNSNILSIYTQLLRSKAIEESKEKRRKIIKNLKDYFGKAGQSVVSSTRAANTYYKDIRKKLKLDKAPVIVSSEISNYLADIQRRLYQLPLIYRYLFENAPVKEINLFLSREKEMENINKALDDWKADNFAATLVVGENGSGKSSLLHQYIKLLKGSYKISFLTINRFYQTEIDYYELIQEVFDDNTLDNKDKIIEHINKFHGQRIIVLDGLERMFLRKPYGFKCIQKLLSLIVSTNQQVFWICSISLHAADYLDKTMFLKEHFDYVVNLNNLSSDEIKNIVLKRNRLSGYIPVYLNEDKNSQKSGHEKRTQVQLENEYFTNLNKFSASNISLSLFYWLESIEEFSEHELYINTFSVPDFSFLETLSPDKVYALLLIVLHGKISDKHHASITNQSTETSNRILTVLKEDSIIIKNGEYYSLNGILYKHVVQLLRNKNLLH